MVTFPSGFPISVCIIFITFSDYSWVIVNNVDKALVTDEPFRAGEPLETVKMVVEQS